MGGRDAGGAAAALMTAKLSPDAEYYRIWTDHPPGSVPSRSRKVDASTLTETSPVRLASIRAAMEEEEESRRMTMAAGFLGQRSFSGPELPIQEEASPTFRHTRMEEEDGGGGDATTPGDTMLVPDSNGMLSILVPNISAAPPPSTATAATSAMDTQSSNTSASIPPQRPPPPQMSGPNWSRRPKTLTSSSATAPSSVSVFNKGSSGSNSVATAGGGCSSSVDSEQSVPRTAPLATPEHDTSLVDSNSAAAVAAGAKASTGTRHRTVDQQESLEGFTLEDEVFEVVAPTAEAEESSSSSAVAANSSSSNTASSSSSSSALQQRNPRLGEIRRLHQREEEDSRNTSLDVTVSVFDEESGRRQQQQQPHRRRSDEMDTNSNNDSQQQLEAMELGEDEQQQSINNNSASPSTGNNCPQFRFESPSESSATNTVMEALNGEEEEEGKRGSQLRSSSSPVDIVNYLSAAPMDSDGLTPSPMSISEEIVDGACGGVAEEEPTRKATFEVGGGDEDDDDDDKADEEEMMSSAPNSVFNSPVRDRQKHKQQQKRGRQERLQLPTVDPIDPSVLGAVGFSVEVTPPPGISK